MGVEAGLAGFELSELMLGVWVCCTGRNPAMDEVSNLLCRILGVVGFVHKLPILSGFARGDLVHVYSLVAELSQELRHEYSSCDVTSRNQVEFTRMSQLPKPEVVRLLIQQGCHR